MGFDWKDVWKDRSDAFNRALGLCPDAREEERAFLIEMLCLNTGLSVLEVGPCGDCLLRGISNAFPHGLTFLAVEPSDENAKHLPDYVQRIQGSDITSFAMADSSVDRVANLAGMHHTSPRTRFFEESNRVLKPGGVAAVADVLDGTQVAIWLNEFVDKYNKYGHEGVFFARGEMTRELCDAGFTAVREQHRTFCWRFCNLSIAISFCRDLFYLNKATDAQIECGLREILGAKECEGEFVVPWELTYAAGQKISEQR